MNTVGHILKEYEFSLFWNFQKFGRKHFLFSSYFSLHYHSEDEDEIIVILICYRTFTVCQAPLVFINCYLILLLQQPLEVDTFNMTFFLNVKNT